MDENKNQNNQTGAPSAVNLAQDQASAPKAAESQSAESKTIQAKAPEINVSKSAGLSQKPESISLKTTDPAATKTNTETPKAIDLSELDKVAQKVGNVKGAFFDVESDQKDKKPQTETSIADQIIKLSEQQKQTKTILGDAPKLNEVKIDKTYFLRRHWRFQYLLSLLILVLYTLSFGFFYTQLSPNFGLFGANLTEQVKTTNQLVIKSQTESNKISFLDLQNVLNSIAFYANKYQEIPAENQEEKQSTVVAIIELIANAKVILARPQTAQVLNTETAQLENPSAEVILQSRKELLADAEKFVDETEKEQSMLYKGASQLMGNQNLLQLISQANPSTLLADQSAFEELISRLSKLSKNNFSIISSLKDQRVHWTEVLNEITAATKRAEEGLIVANEGAFQMQIFESGGANAILFSSYNIDAKTGQISINGTLKTPTEKTFTTMANLIESVESSPMFKEVNYRSFSKNGDPNSGFDSNFRLEFYLEKSLNTEENTN